MKVAVLYASDYASLAPGGIREFVYRVGRFAPDSVSISYIGVGSSPAPLPRAQDDFYSVLENPAPGPLNAQFVSQLARNRALLSEFDVLVAHRPEYLAVTPSSTHAFLVLHGATANAWKTGRRTFGVAYAIAELLACARAKVVLSVDPEGLARWARIPAGAVRPIRVPATEVFWRVVPERGGEQPLITACRLVPEKRVDRLIELASALKRKLLVFGDGPCQSELSELAFSLGADVNFLGNQSPDVLAETYRHGGVFCLSSAFEGYPLAAVEALVAGLPVVGVETRGVKQLHDFGAVTLDRFDDAVDFLRAGPPSLPNRGRAWAEHSPRSVGERFWEHLSAY